MTEGRRLSNRSSIRNTTQLLSDNSNKSKGARSKFRKIPGSQSPVKQHSSSYAPLREGQNMLDNKDNSSFQKQMNRITEPPSKNINYECPKINVKVGFQNQQGSRTVYKLEAPLPNQKTITISSTITRLMRKHHDRSETLKIMNDDKYTYDTLSNLPVVLNEYISQRMYAQQTMPQKPVSRRLYNRVDQLLAQENQFLSANDSTDLSFDGKAMDKNDIFRIVDSFSVAFDDDDEDGDYEDDQYSNKMKNVLPREVTGVF